MKRLERGEMLVEFLFGLFIFGGVAIACFPLGVVALGLAAFATIFYAVVLSKIQRHQSAHLYDGQAAFEAKQRTEFADFLVTNSVEQPWNTKGRQAEWNETPSAWRPSGAELQQAIENNRGKQPRTYTYDLETGKWSRK